MKREIIAAVLLAILIAGVIINSVFLNSLTSELTDMVTRSAQAAENGDMKTSAAIAAEALELWKGYDKYTHIVLNHNELGTVSDAFFELLEEISTGNAEAVKITARLISARLDDISEAEAYSPGSVF